MFTQLNPTLPVTVEGKGKGLAFAVIDYGEERELLWVIALSESREICRAPNPEVRAQGNWSVGRRSAAEPAGANVQSIAGFSASGASR